MVDFKFLTAGSPIGTVVVSIKATNTLTYMRVAMEKKRNAAGASGVMGFLYREKFINI